MRIPIIHTCQSLLQAPATLGQDYSINTPHAIRAKLEHEQPLARLAADAAADGTAAKKEEAVVISPEPSRFEKHARKVVVSVPRSGNFRDQDLSENTLAL